MAGGIPQASPALHPAPRPVSRSLLAEEKKEREPSLIQRISARLSKIYKDPETKLLIEQFKFGSLLSLQGIHQPSLKKMFLYDDAFRKAAAKHNVDIGLLRATVLNEGVFRWDLLNSEGVVDTVTSVIQKGYGGTYGPVQIGPGWRKEIKYRGQKQPESTSDFKQVVQVMSYPDAVDAAAQVLVEERTQLKERYHIPNPSSAHIATAYQVGAKNAKDINTHGRKIEALSKVLSY